MLKKFGQQNLTAWTKCFQTSGSQCIDVQGMQWMGEKTPSLYDLLKNLQHLLSFEDSILIAGLCLMKRTVSKGLKVNENSVYKLALVCLFIAHKLYSDFSFEVEEFSIATGVRSKVITQLENEVLDLLGFDLLLTEKDYHDVLMLNKF